MENVTIIGVDLAKNVFQVHGATADGSVAFRKKLSRPQFHKFMSGQPGCLIVMEACGGAHYGAREMVRLGHEVKLIAPRYVKPFVKRHKTATGSTCRRSRPACATATRSGSSGAGPGVDLFLVRASGMAARLVTVRNAEVGA